MTPHYLKTTRKKLRLSQFAVSKAAKVSRYKISIYENGFGTLFHDEVRRIEIFLDQKKLEASQND